MMTNFRIETDHAPLCVLFFSRETATSYGLRRRGPPCPITLKPGNEQVAFICYCRGAK